MSAVKYLPAGGAISRRALQRHGGGERVQELQKELDKLHHEAKSRVKEGVCVGGGVALWPAMQDMRLSRDEVWKLAVLSVGLMLSTFAVFHVYHGRYRGKPL